MKNLRPGTLGLLERIEVLSGVQTPEMKRIDRLRKQKDRRRRRTVKKEP